MRAAALIALTGCYYASDPAAVGNSVDANVASSEFPCEVAEVLSTCWGCHSDPPRGGAPISLMRRADLMMHGQRALARMRSMDKPMPPPGLPRPDAAAIAKFAAWVDGGMPAGMCEGGPAPVDAGVPMPTCTSGQFWPTTWDDGSPDMNPGLPCRACHSAEEPERAYFFMGTVYPTLHEKDRCFSQIPSGTRVEIIDANGNVALSLPVRPRGNFMSTSRMAGIALPFTARVVGPNGATNSMHTPQMTGDCNGCHTVLGANGAPGRILLPPQ